MFYNHDFLIRIKSERSRNGDRTISFVFIGEYSQNEAQRPVNLLRFNSYSNCRADRSGSFFNADMSFKTMVSPFAGE